MSRRRVREATCAPRWEVATRALSPPGRAASRGGHQGQALRTFPGADERRRGCLLPATCWVEGQHEVALGMQADDDLVMHRFAPLLECHDDRPLLPQLLRNVLELATKDERFE